MKTMLIPVVKIEQGELRGKLCKTSYNKEFYKFKGIPYAKPPVGELRFAIPEPPEPWEGVRDATINCNICPQYDRVSENYIGDEDCLYLNVYTPKLFSDSSDLLPVMFFIHGGGFVFGHGTDDTAHGPEFLIEKNVVIVSFNYRLGILGFLSLNCEEAPGNMGLRDQVQALIWVQKNIRIFGGDPSNVTIFGLSAGGASVEYLMLSPMARGLFHKAIAQSGSSLPQWSHNNKIKDLASKIPVLAGASVKDDVELLEYLRRLPVKDLTIFSMMALGADKFKGGFHFGFVPTIEKSGDWEPFLDKSPLDLLKRGDFAKVPYMTGFCTREGLLMIPMGASTLETLVKEKEFLKHLPIDLDDTYKKNMEDKFKTVYLTGENEYNDDDYFAIDFFTDETILGGVYTAAIMIAKNNNNPVFLYEFAYDGSINYVKKLFNIDRKGACHGDDIGYLLKHSSLTDDLTDADKFVRDSMVKLWTNFAKYGDPTPNTDGLISSKWKPMKEAEPVCLVIDEKLYMKEGVYSDRMKLFMEFYDKYYNY